MKDAELERLLQMLHAQYKKVELLQSVGTEIQLYIALKNLEGMAQQALWRMNDLRFPK